MFFFEKLPKYGSKLHTKKTKADGFSENDQRFEA